MSIKIRQGNFEKMGVRSSEHEATFTFECKNGDNTAILLYPKKGGKEIRVDIPADFRIGTMVSITVQGISLLDYDYNFVLNDHVINDPYAVSIVGREKWGDESRLQEGFVPKSRFVASDFDWTGDRRPKLADEDMLMYKLHVRCFTMQGKAKGKARGTFRGVAEAIPYLNELGVTVVEMMPVYEFEELMQPAPKNTLLNYASWKAEREEKETKKKVEKAPVKLNVWGYRDANYMAPKLSYACTDDAERELKELVHTLHENGMECILEFFFPEGHSGGYIVEILRHWVRDYHIDGFHLLGYGIPMNQILTDPLLSDTKIFAPGFTEEFISGNKEKNRLFVYNEEYLYPARKMLNRLEMNLNDLVREIVKTHAAQGFVNYIAANNGFTMTDLFSYAEKHNEANGEGNIDGSNWNYSANYGEEGDSRRKAVLADRKRQLRNAFSLLLLSKGVPLIYEGDECGNSKNGNNNSYCQDNAISYVEWSVRKRDRELTEFIKQLIEFRKNHPVLTDRAMYTHTCRPESGLPEISYHGENAWMSGPEYGRCAIGILYCGEYVLMPDGKPDDMLYVAYNFMGGQQSLALPKLPYEGDWMKIMDTAVEGEAFLETPERTRDQKIMLPGRSVRIYIGQKKPAKRRKKK